MRIFVDANPKSIAVVVEGGKSWVEPLGPTNTNNTAEYQAIIVALKHATLAGMNLDELEILSDAQIVVRQLNYEYSIKVSKLRDLAQKVWDISQGRVTFTWIPRKQNLAGKVLG